MIRTVIIYTFIFIHFSFLSCAQKKEYQIAAVAFYNLENLFHPSDEPNKFDEDFTPEGKYQYTEEIYAKKLRNIAAVLSRVAIDKVPEGPALVGVAEVENRLVLQDLMNRPELKSRRWKAVHFDSPDSRGIDVALLYHPRFFKLLGARVLPVDLQKKEKRNRTRDVLYVMGTLAGDTLHILVNHWPSRHGGTAASEWKRSKAATINRSFIDSVLKLNANANIIVMGDFNDQPVSPSLKEVLGAEGNVKKLEPAGLYNPWASFYRKGRGTIAHNDRWSLFDQIIISYSFLDPTNHKRWKYYQSEIFSRDFLITPSGRYKGYPKRSFSGSRWADGYSDHLPVITYLIKAL